MKTDSGLCSTCHHGVHCAHLAENSRPVLQCEEFLQLPVANGFQVTEVRTESDDQQESTTFAGLCFNCNHRYDCTLRLATGNVWHCEEYE